MYKGLYLSILIANCYLNLAFAGYGDGCETVSRFFKNHGLAKKLSAPVNVSVSKTGYLEIRDTGNFLYQFLVSGREESKNFDINVLIDEDTLNQLRSKDNIVVITHGWVDNACDSWPAKIAEEIYSRVESKDWAVVIFDWRHAAAVANPIDAAKYARDIGGYRLAKSLERLFCNTKHIHFIGHSAGVWVVDSAISSLKTDRGNLSIHITFLDAFIPMGWDNFKIASIDDLKQIWVEQYYNRDYTLTTTEQKIACALNIDLTNIEPGVKEHKFPFRWYWATIVGHYGLDNREINKTLIYSKNGIDYGFARSREFSEQAWQESLLLGRGNIELKDKTPIDEAFNKFKSIYKY